MKTTLKQNTPRVGRVVGRGTPCALLAGVASTAAYGVTRLAVDGVYVQNGTDFSPESLCCGEKQFPVGRKEFFSAKKSFPLAGKSFLSQKRVSRWPERDFCREKEFPAGRKEIFVAKKSFPLSGKRFLSQKRVSRWPERVFCPEKEFPAGQKEIFAAKKTSRLAGNGFLSPKGFGSLAKAGRGAAAKFASSNQGKPLYFTTCNCQVSLLKPPFETGKNPFPKNAVFVSSACSSIDPFRNTRLAGEVLLALAEALARPMNCGVRGRGHKIQTVTSAVNRGDRPK